MPRVLIRNYSNYFDVGTRVQFEPIVDVRTGCFVGAANVSEELAAVFARRRGFEVLDETTFAAVSSLPAEDEPSEPLTGDPLGDAAKSKADKPAGKPKTDKSEFAAKMAAARAAKKAETAAQAASNTSDKSAPPPPPPSK